MELHDVCAMCYGEHHEIDAPLKDCYFVQPDPKHGDTRVRATMCEECQIVHWAWEVNPATK